MTIDEQTAFDEYSRAVAEGSRLLPAWFVPRMMDDEWFFGLILTTGQMLAITHIDDVRQAADGTIWLDVNMTAKDDGKSLFGEKWDGQIMFSPTTRLRASVNAAHVVCAVELADT